MKYAIALGCGHACMFWNGMVFTADESQAARFPNKECADNAMRLVFRLEEPPEDADFVARLYTQAIA